MPTCMSQNTVHSSGYNIDYIQFAVCRHANVNNVQVSQVLSVHRII